MSYDDCIHIPKFKCEDVVMSCTTMLYFDHNSTSRVVSIFGKLYSVGRWKIDNKYNGCELSTVRKILGLCVY